MIRPFTGNPSRGRRRFFFILAVLFAVFIVAVVYLHQKADAYRRIPEVRFDPARVVRVHEVSRVYAITRDPRFPGLLWFACEEGLHALSEAEYRWKRYGLDHGLPGESVRRAVVAGQDLYAATDQGLGRLASGDERFTTVPGTAGLDIQAVDTGAGRTLHFFARGKGLFRLAESSAQPVRIPMRGLSDTVNVTFLKTRGPWLFLGAEGLGVFRVDPRAGTAQAMVFDRKLSRRALFLDALFYKNRFYVATSYDGLFCADTGRDTLRYVESFPGKGAFAFTAEPDGFWCGTPWGLWRHYDNGAWIQFVHPDERKPGDFQVFALEGAGPLLWYGSRDMGGGYFNKQRVNWQPLRAGLNRPNVAALVRMGEGVFAAYGYQGGGLDRFDAASLRNSGPFAPNAGLDDPHLQCFLAAGSRLYFGGFESFGWIDPERDSLRTWGRNSELPAVDIAQIVPSATGSLLLASCFGIIEYSPATDGFFQLPGTEAYRITVMLPGDDRIVFGTLGNGIMACAPRGGSRRGPWLAGFGRIAGAAWAGESLFVATQRGGCHLLDPATGGSRPLPVPDSLLMPHDPSANEITALGVSDGDFWVATRNDGCLVYSPAEDRWRGFSFYNGLVNDQVRTIVDEGRFLWIGCYGGFNRIDKETLKSWRKAP